MPAYIPDCHHLLKTWSSDLSWLQTHFPVGPWPVNQIQDSTSHKNSQSIAITFILLALCFCNLWACLTAKSLLLSSTTWLTDSAHSFRKIGFLVKRFKLRCYSINWVHDMSSYHLWSLSYLICFLKSTFSLIFRSCTIIAGQSVFPGSLLLPKMPRNEDIVGFIILFEIQSFSYPGSSRA